MQRARCPWALALASAGRRRLARIAIIAITTSNSMRVNAERARGAKFMRGLKGRLASALRGGELCFRQLSSGFQRIFAAGGVSIENAANLIADITKDSKNFF